MPFPFKPRAQFKKSSPSSNDKGKRHANIISSVVINSKGDDCIEGSGRANWTSEKYKQQQATSQSIKTRIHAAVVSLPRNGCCQQGRVCRNAISRSVDA